jgi:hypothetical protein
MPVITITSLPFERPRDVRNIIEGISMDFSRDTGISIEHVSASWHFLLPGHYAVGGVSAQYQSARSHPVLVDLLVPDFNSEEKVEGMLNAIAESVSRRGGVSVDNIFINCRYANSGMVFDAGRVVKW